MVCCLKKKPATLAAYFIHGQLEIDPLHRILHQQLVASACETRTFHRGEGFS